MEKIWDNIPEAEPDEIDLAMIAESEIENDEQIFTQKDIEDARTYNGVLSIRTV